MHAPYAQLLQDLALVMLVAGLVTVVFHRLKQPVVLGYLLAGLIVSPHTSIPLRVGDEKTVKILAELGVILLMFSLGLHFSFRKLLKVGPTAVIAATLEIVAMIGLGYAVGQWFGWSRMDSVFLGAILAISSTTIIIKALEELKLTKQRFSQLIFGILIVEDILAIAMIALLSAAATNALEVGTIAVTFGKLLIFLAAVMVVGLLIVPPLLRYVSRFRSNEVLLITALALCFGVSLIALQLGYSVALGAFLIGAIIAETREHGRVETLVEPVRDMFSAIFFVAIGMLIDPRMLAEYWLPIVVITTVVIVGKVTTCSAGAFLAGNDARTSMRVGMGLAQIGEFSFIIAQLGLSLKVVRDGVEQPATSGFLYPIAVTVSAITTLATPYLIKSSDAAVELAARLTPPRAHESVRLYTAWVDRLASRPTNTVRRLLRRWSLQIVLNLALIGGLFIAAAAVSRKWTAPWPLPHWSGGTTGVMWLAAMLLSLPMIIVSVRKLRAIALVSAEATIRERDCTSLQQMKQRRGVTAGAIRVFGLVFILVYLLLLSSTVLPPWPVLIVMLLSVAGIAVWRRQSLERLYAVAQSSLSETLNRPETGDVDLPHSMPAALANAQLATVEITPGAPACGRLIRELALRTASGASAVAIERESTAPVINPGPDEELQQGDKVLLIGTPVQLASARQVLIGH